MTYEISKMRDDFQDVVQRNGRLRCLLSRV